MNGDKVLPTSPQMRLSFNPLSPYFRFCCYSCCWETFLLTLGCPKVGRKYKQKFVQNTLYPARKCLVSLKLAERKERVENIMSIKAWYNISFTLLCSWDRTSLGLCMNCSAALCKTSPICSSISKQRIQPCIYSNESGHNRGPLLDNQDF